MKLLLSMIFIITLILGGLWLQKSHEPKIDIISHLGFNECEFVVEYGVDSTFSEQDYFLISDAVSKWVLASDKRLCFTLYSIDVKWHEYFTLFFDKNSIIYNAQGGIWQQAGLWLNPHCQREGCVGLAFWTGDIFLTNYNIYLVAIHEIGHTLGLPHSSNRDDVMYYHIGAIKVSVDDKRVLKCLMDQEEPLLWGNNNCFYEERGSQ